MHGGVMKVFSSFSKEYSAAPRRSKNAGKSLKKQPPTRQAPPSLSAQQIRDRVELNKKSKELNKSAAKAAHISTEVKEDFGDVKRDNPNDPNDPAVRGKLALSLESNSFGFSDKEREVLKSILADDP